MRLAGRAVPLVPGVDDLGGRAAVGAEAVPAVPRQHRRRIRRERRLAGGQLGGDLAQARRVARLGLRGTHVRREHRRIARESEENLRPVGRPEQQPPVLDPDASLGELDRASAGVGAAGRESLRVAAFCGRTVEIGAGERDHAGQAEGRARRRCPRSARSAAAAG